MHLTPDILRAAYEYLRATPPFRRWKLPEGDAVGFRVTRHGDTFGQTWHLAGKLHQIDTSARLVGATDTLIRTMAHEMIHIYHSMKSIPVRHGAAFLRDAAAVCRQHGFDPKVF